ncbi:MFS transporter [Embleya sp. NBC_00896]|uniref:MFS transporter n=1 Tax=Embleya sp. NBC_00896 TaxID=2975961 RepID=UPI003867BD65|nr:MFS transporter [Embleya sp. NBC_00896]
MVGSTALRPVRDPRRWAVLAILSGSLLIISMDATILNVAFPSLVTDLQPGSVEQLWIIDAYALVLAGLLVTAGALGDRWGRKRLLLIGFAIFGLASLLAVVATAAWHVIAARALLGVGGAAIMPSTLTILRTVFTDARELALAYSVWSAVFGGGMALGPVIGGVLVESHGWQSAFLLNVPIAVAVIGFGTWLLPESRSPRSGVWDWPGVGLSIFGMVALAGGIKQLGKSGVSDPAGWTLVVLSVVALTVFVRRQLRLTHPLLQVRLFTNRAFTMAATAIFLGMLGLGAALFLLSQWFQYVKGYSPVAAGVHLLPAPISLILASLCVPWFMERFPPRNVLASGLTLMSAGLALPWVWQHFREIDYPLVSLALAIVGAGVGTLATVASVVLMSSVPTAEAGGAAAIDETAYELGAALGVATLGSMASALYRSKLPYLDLDPADLAAVHESIGDASVVADRLGTSGLLVTAGEAFTSSMTPTFLVGGGVALVAAVLAWRLIPRDLERVEGAH